MKQRMFKGFTPNMTCRNFQYEIGKSYKEDNAELCVTGFHACEYPLDCFRYYSPESNVFCEVELDEMTGETCKDVGGRDTKRVGKGITVKKQLHFRELISEAIEYIKNKRPDRYDFEHGKGVMSTDGDYSAAEVDCYASVAASDLDSTVVRAQDSVSVACVTGDCSGALTEQESSAAVVTGGKSVCVADNTGSVAAALRSESVAIVDGQRSIACTTGYNCVASAESMDSIAVASGDFSDAQAMRRESLAIAYGEASRVRGKLGSWLVLVEHDEVCPIIIKNIHTLKVDGENIKPDVWYMLNEDGEVIEYKEDI